MKELMWLSVRADRGITPFRRRRGKRGRHSPVRARRLAFDALESRVLPGSLMDLLLPAWMASASADAETALFASTGDKQGEGKSGPTTTNTVGGEAYGVHVSVAVDHVGHAELAKTPHVVLPEQGGFETKTVLAISAGHDGSLAQSDTLIVMTSGAIGAHVATSQSSATVENVHLLNGRITAELVTAFSSSHSDGQHAASNGAGSILVGLTIDGHLWGTVAPQPNTVIALPGLGRVILNEQIFGGDGKVSASLTVNMIHVQIDALLGQAGGDIIVASASSSVNFRPAPIDAPAFMTGGGRLGSGRDFATFGFNAGARGEGGVHGQLQYVDHATGMNVHGTSVTAFAVHEGEPCATFSGMARVNGADGYQFTVHACDHGEPGVGRDTFRITVSGADVQYDSSLAYGSVLTGGNLQLHRAD